MRGQAATHDSRALTCSVGGDVSCTRPAPSTPLRHNVRLYHLGDPKERQRPAPVAPGLEGSRQSELRLLDSRRPLLRVRGVWQHLGARRIAFPAADARAGAAHIWSSEALASDAQPRRQALVRCRRPGERKAGAVRHWFKTIRAISMRAGLPSWSPDGTQIAFDGQTGSRRLKVFLIPAGGGPARRLTDDETSDEFDPSWSPDGRRVLYARGSTDPASGNGDLRILELSTRQVSVVPKSQGLWSPR